MPDYVTNVLSYRLTMCNATGYSQQGFMSDYIQ